jgi:heme/copper-type cytochrome/quinol oxidase subunit 3
VTTAASARHAADDPRDGTARADRAADVAVLLVLASVLMFFASLYSGFVLLRAGSDSWPAPWAGRTDLRGATEPWLRLLWLLVAIVAARLGERDPRDAVAPAGAPLHAGTAAALAFVAHTVVAGQALAALGHTPSANVAVATWFALNGVLAALVLCGAIAATWTALTADPPTRRRRARGLARYWTLLAVCFLAVLAGMYLT